MSTRWLDPSELRVGLGCMRLSTDAERDDERALATIAAAVHAGITVFDTAHSYGRDEAELGHNERLLARALRASGGARRSRIVTKGGMARPGGAWVPDGRAKSIRADCEASLEALDGLGADMYLLHAPDPRTPWRTSVRALARLVEDGLVPRVGVSNVSRGQLDQALALAPIAAVQVAVSPSDDRALRGGVVERCEAAGIAVIAHSPLGGPRRAAALARNEVLAGVAASHGARPAEVVLASLLEVSPMLVPIPGARRPETARSAARAAELELDDDDRSRLGRSLGGARPRRLLPPSGRGDGEVVLVMGIPGAGKSRIAAEYVDRGHVRLNRDERGGSLRDVAAALEDALSAGTPQLVLDNTYLTRAARSHVLERASQHGVPTRCVWLDTPLAQAQVNLVERLLDRFGHLPPPEEVKEHAREPGVMAPTSQMRALRDLEPPSADEGFTSVRRVAFVREPRAGSRNRGVFVAAAALDAPGWRSAIEGAAPGAPHLLFDWRPDGSPDDLTDGAALLSMAVSGPVDRVVCPHGGGAPICWCRPPLPGLPLAFARSRGVDLARSTLIGTSTAHRTLAATLGARFVKV